ncbi:Angio-associated migratory cell protein [Toxocara canis]|uniref:Angio-associated migratory cell protein n=1 Tax=Toxocara canis TaxID=6265 RepID=A0A0B2V714_TOXCA|nr:Angio-associated migratory cell protein [Toxocara canis]
MDGENSENNGVPFRSEDIIKVIELEDVLEGGKVLDGTDVESSDRDSVNELEGQEWEEEGSGMEIPDEAQISIRVHEKDVFCVHCCGDNWLASGGEDDQALLFDLSKKVNEPVLRICGHVDSVTCIRFNASASLLASGDMSGKIIITETASLKMRCEMEDPSELEWLEWHASADILFAGAGDGIVWMWLIGSQGVSQTKVFAGSAGVACTVGRLLSDGKRLLAGYADGAVRIWSLKDSTSVSLVTGSPCICSHLHASLPIAAVGGECGTCTLVSTHTSKILKVFNPQDITARTKDEDAMDAQETSSNSIECVRFCDANESWLAIGTNSGRLAIYDFTTDTARYICEHDGRTVVACRFYRDPSDGAPLVLTACLDGVLRVWDARDGQPVATLCGGGDEIFDAHLWEHSRRIVTACANGKVRIFALPLKSS